MTLDEKLGQMTQPDRGSLAAESDIATYFLGSLLSGGGSAPSPNTPTAWADMYDRYQRVALSTRFMGTTMSMARRSFRITLALVPRIIRP